jgi:tRNA dimethylallyltransferase
MQKVIAIVGPTASGKTALGIYLAKKLGGEVISADSRQLYRGMDIIAATPSKKEMDGVPHHLLRVAHPKREYSAGEYVRETEKLLPKLAKRNAIPIVVGGTGFYVNALLSDMIIPEVAPDEKLRARLYKKSAHELFSMLKKLDPVRAKTIDPHNPARLVRAIEIAKKLGKVPPIQYAKKYDVLWLGLSPLKDKHKAAIRARIRARFKQGLVAEAKRLRAMTPAKRFQALGTEYRLLADFIDKKISRQELEEKLEQWEKLYARRQMRWHKRNTKIVWLKNNAQALKLSKEFLDGN